MKKVTLERVKKGVQHRSKLHKRMNLKINAPHCFICDEEIVGRGVPLLISHTSYTKTGLPTKIGQLMGEGFMVVVSIEDMLCNRCGALLNHLDKLEYDLDIVKRALTGYLKMKYGLLEEGDEHIQPEKDNLINQKPTEELPNMNPDDKLNNSECISEDSGGSESKLQTSHNKVNNSRTIEILLDESNACKDYPQNLKNTTESQKDLSKVYKCKTCNFETSSFFVFHSHFSSCSELPYKCSICDKRFESHKYVRTHIMEAHLSNWICHFCNNRFSDEKEFTLHIKTHLVHQSNTSKLQLDELLSASGSEDASYGSSQNLLGNYECNICDYQCNNKKVFDDHVRKHVILKNFQCKICKKRFQNREALTQHIENHNKVETFKCQSCTAEFDKKIRLMEHLETHKESEDMKEKLHETRGSEKTEFSNQKVDKITDKSSAEEHFNSPIAENQDKQDSEKSVENKSNEIAFHTCHICSLTFVNELLFIEHIKMHAEEEPNKELFNTDASQLLEIDKDDLDDDTSEHDVNSLDSEGRHQYVEMDESLEDMFEKLHAETEKATAEKRSESSQETVNQNMTAVFKCNICHEDFMNDDELQIHKVTRMHLENDSTSESNKISLNVDNKSDMKITVKEEPNHCKIEQNTINMALDKDTVPGKADNGSCVEKSVVEPAEQNFTETSEHLSMQDVSAGNEGTKSSFLNIFDMVREKKLSSNDDEEIDHNLLQSICIADIKTEDTEEPIVPVMDMLPYVPSDIKQVRDGILYSTPPSQSKKTYVCAMCGFRTPQMYELKKHFKEHKQNAFRCKLCSKIFPSTPKLLAHMKSHEKLRGKMTCPYCYEEFPEKSSLQQHFQEKHQKEKVVYRCSFCNETFNTKKAYKMHEEIHPERFSFKCDECDQQFLKEKQLLDHKDAVHRDPHCRFCGKEIMKAKTLRNHELRHIREKDSFECDICKRVFKTKTGLRHHVAVHTGEYKYCCSYCGRGFMSRMMMEEHLSMHTKEERYICDVCGRKFSFQSTYWIHRKWHDNPYPYKCSFCGRMFRHSSLLAVHKRKHTGERPYKCPHCPLTFPVGGTLKRHLILHTGVYPFNCDSCKRGFTTRHKYATHLAKIHSDFNMLHAKAPQNEFKMVIREESKPVQQPPAWEVANNTLPDQINFKFDTLAGQDVTNKNTIGEGIACTIVSDDLLVDNTVPTRVVEIVLDEASQAVASVTLAEHVNFLPDIWYQ